MSTEPKRGVFCVLRGHICGHKTFGFHKTSVDTIGAYLIVDKIFSVDFSDDLGPAWKVGLLANAELAEDEVEDVVGGGGAGEGVEGVEGFVEIEQDHLVGDGCRDTLLGSLECV